MKHVLRFYRFVPAFACLLLCLCLCRRSSEELYSRWCRTSRPYCRCVNNRNRVPLQWRLLLFDPRLVSRKGRQRSDKCWLVPVKRSWNEPLTDAYTTTANGGSRIREYFFMRAHVNSRATIIASFGSTRGDHKMILNEFALAFILMLDLVASGATSGD